MSGWIKIEKSIETDPRVIRMAKHVAALFGNAPALPAVTLVCGALTRLWMYADSHIRDDNTLDLGASELDEWLGIPGFCGAIPDDWLREIDEHTVELPGFQEHNGVEARKKAQTQKRVERHRTAKKPTSVSPSNADALPDQTRPDQTKTRPEEDKSDVADATTGAVERVFAHWQSAWSKTRAKLDAKRRKLIRSALSNYSEADLCQAISGYRNSPHHMGRNDRSTVYDDIELFLRDAKHIDAGLNFYANPPRTDLSAKTQRIIDQTESWTPPEMRHAAN